MKFSTLSTKRFVSAFLSLLIAASLTSCKSQNPASGDEANINTTKAQTTTEEITVNTNAINPLTGIQNMDPSAVGKRPVGIMINNIKTAQPVQTSVGKADMVYETLVEGGITRLLAIYSDIKSIGQIGSVRSGRYSFVEIACGLDAAYVYSGLDEKYARPLINELGVDKLDLGGNAQSAGRRLSNGLAHEHTLYTYGEKLYDVLKKGRTDIKSRAANIYSFNSPLSPEKLPGSATDISVRFSSSYITTFKYDSETKKYIRGNSNGTAFKDYVTAKSEQFKNVFILYSNVYELSDNLHMKTDLESGSGVYISEGGQKPIKWSKNGLSKPITFTDESGKELKLNAGNSYICITDKDNKSATSIN